MKDKRNDTRGHDGVAHPNVVVGPGALQPVERVQVDIRVKRILGGGRVRNNKLVGNAWRTLVHVAHRNIVGGGHRGQILVGGRREKAGQGKKRVSKGSVRLQARAKKRRGAGGGAGYASWTLVSKAVYIEFNSEKTAIRKQ